MPVRCDALSPLPIRNALQVGQPAPAGEMRSRAIGRTGPRAAGHGDDALDAKLRGEPDRLAELAVVAGGDLGVRVQWVAGNVQGRDAEARVVDRLPPARRGRRPAEQLAWAAVWRRRVNAEAGQPGGSWGNSNHEWLGIDATRCRFASRPMP